MTWKEIVKRMTERLMEKGFTPVYVDYDPDMVRVRTPDEVVEEVGAVDFSRAVFRHPDTGSKTYWITLIPANGIDVICDWGVPNSDPAGWNDALDLFLDEVQA